LEGDAHQLKAYSSVEKYVVRKGGDAVNEVLEDQLRKLMESVCKQLHQYVGYDVLLYNCNL